MNLSSIRENYGKLLTAFSDAGVKLSEAQKADLDEFMVAFESKIEQTKNAAILATKEVLERRLGEEYKKVFESILKHQAENAELAGKIQTKINSINESKKMAEKVDQYLESYLEKIVPESEIVDYDRLKKLEKLVDSLKETLVVSDDVIEKKSKELDEKFQTETEELTEKISVLEKRLNESMSNELALKKEISVAKAKDFVARKTRELPFFEAKQVQKRLTGLTLNEAKSSYGKVLEAVREELKEATKLEEKNLEEEINNIIESSEKRDKVEKTESVKTESVETEAEDPIESEYDSIVLEESEKINATLMKGWIERLGGITPFDNSTKW